MISTVVKSIPLSKGREVVNERVVDEQERKGKEVMNLSMEDFGEPDFNANDCMYSVKQISNQAIKQI